jgi:hypothetical protein
MKDIVCKLHKLFRITQVSHILENIIYPAQHTNACLLIAARKSITASEAEQIRARAYKMGVHIHTVKKTLLIKIMQKIGIDIKLKRNISYSIIRAPDPFLYLKEFMQPIATENSFVIDPMSRKYRRILNKDILITSTAGLVSALDQLLMHITCLIVGERQHI